MFRYKVRRKIQIFFSVKDNFIPKHTTSIVLKVLKIYSFTQNSKENLENKYI